MTNDNNFTAWAMDRAEAIIRDQGLELLQPHDCQSNPTREQQVLRLTMAIVEALIDARNFHLRRESSHIPKPH